MPGLFCENKETKVRLADDAARYILEKTCADRSYSARPLRRALQKYIEDPLSEALIQGALPRPSELEIFLSDTGIFCRQVKEGEEEGQPVGVGGGGEAETETSIPLYKF